VTIAADTPFLPIDLVEKLIAALHGDQTAIALASSNDRIHPVVGLWPVQLADALEEFLTRQENRKVLAFVDNHSFTSVPFGQEKKGQNIVDPFYNVNTIEQLKTAETILAERNS
jgi:molybdopterin-guanine dinucleotide biosynthesis protein A